MFEDRDNIPLMMYWYTWDIWDIMRSKLYNCGTNQIDILSRDVSAYYDVRINYGVYDYEPGLYKLCKL